VNNLSKIYNDYVEGVKEDKPNPNDIKKDLFVNNHEEWLQHPITKRFLSAIDKTLYVCVDSAVEGSVTGVSDDTLKVFLNQAKMIKKIKKYAYEDIIRSESI